MTIIETKSTGTVICAYCGLAGHTMGRCVEKLRDEAERRAQAELEQG